MVIVLFDTTAKKGLYPLAQNKAVAALRYGIFSIKERWEAISGLPVFIKAENHLAALYEPIPEDEYLLIDASLKDEDVLRAQILSLQPGDALHDKAGLIAGRTTAEIVSFKSNLIENYFSKMVEIEQAQRLQFPWQLFLWSNEQLRKDFLLQFARSTTETISETNKVIQPENIIIEEGAVMEHCMINASTGPVYIGKNAVVMEGSMLRGPIAICENAVVKMGTTIYGGTTIGPYCTAAGEIKNSILQAYSNKAHHGYLGDSVLGEWCNLGAGTSTSNIKNSGADVMVWNKAFNQKMNAGKKCGMIMGDYSRTAINTAINSGTVIGICCNVFGEGLTQPFIKDFTWGMGFEPNYTLPKALEHINNWKEMKGEKLSSAEISVLNYIFERRL